MSSHLQSDDEQPVPNGPQRVAVDVAAPPPRVGGRAGDGGGPAGVGAAHSSSVWGHIVNLESNYLEREHWNNPSDVNVSI